MLAQVEDGRVVRIQGDHANPLTAGFACAKVNRDHELVHSPRRLATPLRRVGPKGEGKFAPIGWDEALDEIVARWKAIIAESGPLALLGYAYSAHQGQMNRGLVNGLFHALGASRLQAGTVCDTCCETAWDLTVGPVGGADPESVAQSDLIVSWGADLMATNVHLWAKVEEARKKGVQVVVIDPRRSRTAQRADWHLPDPHRHGCRAGAGHDAHPGARRPVRRELSRRPHASASTGSGPRSCRASRRRGWPRSPGSAWPTSSASPPCTGGPRRPSSASARA